jgi:hypothetical protein
MNTMKKSGTFLLDVLRRLVWKLNTEKAMYMFMLREQIERQDHSIEMDSKPCENLAKFKLNLLSRRS